VSTNSIRNHNTLLALIIKQTTELLK